MHRRGCLITLLPTLMLCTSLAHALDIGEAAPTFVLPSLHATPQTSELIELAMQRGKVVYVDFWASWCAPCRVSMPLLDALRTRLQAEGAAFEVMAVNVDEDVTDGRDYLLDTPVSYLVVSDPSGATPAAYELQGMPTGFLLDASGNIRLIHQGFKRGDITPLEQEIRALLDEAAD